VDSAQNLSVILAGKGTYDHVFCENPQKWETTTHCGLPIVSAQHIVVVEKFQYKKRILVVNTLVEKQIFIEPSNRPNRRTRNRFKIL
jgi:hypothetical protein